MAHSCSVLIHIVHRIKVEYSVRTLSNHEIYEMGVGKWCGTEQWSGTGFRFKWMNGYVHALLNLSTNRFVKCIRQCVVAAAASIDSRIHVFTVVSNWSTSWRTISRRFTYLFVWRLFHLPIDSQCFQQALRVRCDCGVCPTVSWPNTKHS